MANGARRALRIGPGAALGLVVVGVCAVLAGAVAIFGLEVSVQSADIIRKAQESLAEVARFAKAQPWGAYALNHVGTADVTGLSQAVAPWIRSLVASIGRGGAYAAIIIVSGLFLAIDPQRHRKGLLILAPPSRRARAEAYLDRCYDILRRWLVSRAIVMVVIGVMAGVGLKLLGVDAAFTLGLTGGLLTFIPLVGALVATVPAILVALAQSAWLALWVALMFWAIHFIEGTFITPLVQDDQVSLPPVLTIFSTVLFAIVFGPSGVILATPAMLVLIVAIQMFYLEDVLGESPPPPITSKLFRRPRAQ
jgi:predicted PurR-regulated permease PerM